MYYLDQQIKLIKRPLARIGKMQVTIAYLLETGHRYSRKGNDPGFIHLCHILVCRNAEMLRHVMSTFRIIFMKEYESNKEGWESK